MLRTLKVSVFDVVRHHNIMDEGFLALSSPELCAAAAAAVARRRRCGTIAVDGDGA